MSIIIHSPDLFRGVLKKMNSIKYMRQSLTSRVGIISLLFIVCMGVPGMAELFPAFDMNNQNGMPSYYYPVGDYVIFTDRTTSSVPNESVMAYNWTITRNCPSGSNCSDENVVICSNSSVPTFVFGPLFADTYPSNYTMNLTVVSNQYPWTSKSWEQMFTVDDYSEYIRANFSYSVDYETTQPNVTFFDLSEAQKLALINDWYWTIDGVQMGDSKSPIVSENLDPGVYKVNLTVRDKTGDIASISKDIVVTESPEPAVDFVAVPQSGSTPLNVTFIDQSSSNLPIVSYYWDFGDGTNATNVSSPIHQYSASGTWNVSLTIINSAGISVSSVKQGYIISHEISHDLQADFSAIQITEHDPFTGNAPFEVHFIDLSTGEPSAWTWNFGDGSTSSEKSPIHWYMRPGSYDVSLDVYNQTKKDPSRITKEVTIVKYKIQETTF